MDIDARLEVPPQQASCHSVHCGGMSALEDLLEFLRQLGIAVKVRMPIWAKVPGPPEDVQVSFIFIKVLLSHPLAWAHQPL